MIQTGVNPRRTNEKTRISTLYHNPLSADAVIQPPGFDPESLHQHLASRDTGS